MSVIFKILTKKLKNLAHVPALTTKYFNISIFRFEVRNVARFWWFYNFLVHDSYGFGCADDIRCAKWHSGHHNAMDLRYVCCHSLPSHVWFMASFWLLHILGVSVFSPVWFHLDGVQLLLCIGRQISSTKFEKTTSPRNCGHLRSSMIHILELANEEPEFFYVWPNIRTFIFLLDTLQIQYRWDYHHMINYFLLD